MQNSAVLIHFKDDVTKAPKLTFAYTLFLCEVL